MTLQKTPSFKTHFVFWILYFLGEVAINYSFHGHFYYWIDYASYCILNICLFYTHAHLVYKHTADKKRTYIVLIICTVAEILCYLLIKYLVVHLFSSIKVVQIHHTSDWLPWLRNAILRAIYFIGLSTLYAFGRSNLLSLKKITDLNTQQLVNQLKLQNLETNLLTTENAFLKAQVNPHFLFNAINVIYDEVSAVSEPAGELLVNLSTVMRYAMAEPASDGKVKLIEEIEHAESYILLNQHRFNKKLQLTFSVSGNPEQIRIIPLVLITILENVFKYGNLSDAEHPASIELDIKAQEFNLTVQNKKLKKANMHSFGIGMSNLEKRLNRAYDNSHLLIVHQDEETYYLNLTIPSHCYELLHY